MPKRKPVIDHAEAFEQAIKDAATSQQRYVLRLYVTGSTPRSSRAIQTIRTLCEQHLSGRYDLEVIDIHQQPVLARGEQIIAAPTLIKKLPAPLRKIIGDLSNTDRVLMGLDLQPRAAATGASASADGAADERERAEGRAGADGESQRAVDGQPGQATT
jgi:circadian clock protein KaiB